ncbi:sporulation protein YqfC [uncultured Roseburia sp.]|uniref:YabP/YqfC family sporulation protein n=1 Tax=Brotonthovivens ammoniilytica TaxID=2981725 RepID=A0ABT2THM5_9FIRM|nr:YabP/YqfC family sporulation protein [Brotonthovivens ammoniilytica]MCU6761206.1 YabP/YqfC family sporulation protein [Brotonthovivens ammoniilytica]SCI21895.1 sporulation protein YqfC [uncultured Roseburia sp.]
MVHRLELPKDLMFGAVLVHITGQSEIEIENYRGILLYGEDRIRLSIKGGQMEVTGRSLKIDYYTNDNMKITGYIQQVSYIM